MCGKWFVVKRAIFFCFSLARVRTFGILMNMIPASTGNDGSQPELSSDVPPLYSIKNARGSHLQINFKVKKL